ncbi:MAG TPA: periplasmic heavy metal sensor [Beijerinckiaceae bacterium]|nr:periplasmic heavy metal sensor [Beijerinckiaceae bacterium]
MRIAALLTTVAAGPALAQHQDAPAAPYAGLDRRTVKALSDEQIADLRAGRGMGLALAAELNGYPGPVHVLEHAEALGLSPDQRTRVRTLHEAMRREAVPLGERLIEQETDLGSQFAGRTITPAGLDHATVEIGRTQAALRTAHLKYHLAMMDVLTPAQVARYGELRGYRGTHPASGGHGGHGHQAR